MRSVTEKVRFSFIPREVMPASSLNTNHETGLNDAVDRGILDPGHSLLIGRI